MTPLPAPASIFRSGSTGRLATAMALALSAWLTGCVVAPTPGYPPAQPQAMPPAYPSAAYPAAGEEWVPPQEYVVGGAPVYYDVDPGVAYYPMYLNTPGSCNCVVPMRYANGVWLGLGGVVLHRGNLSLARPAPYQYDAWTRSGGVWRGYTPVPGRWEYRSGRPYAVPPAGGIHYRQWEQQRRPQMAPPGPPPVAPRVQPQPPGVPAPHPQDGRQPPPRWGGPQPAPLQSAPLHPEDGGGPMRQSPPRMAPPQPMPQAAPAPAVRPPQPAPQAAPAPAARQPQQPAPQRPRRDEPRPPAQQPDGR